MEFAQRAIIIVIHLWTTYKLYNERTKDDKLEGNFSLPSKNETKNVKKIKSGKGIMQSG